MRLRIPFLLFAALCAASASASLDFTSGGAKAIAITPEASTGLEGLYVLQHTAGVEVTYTATSTTGSFSVSRFSNLGGGHSEPVAASRNGARITFTALAGDMGYIIEEGGRQHCYWLTDYSQHRFEIRSVGFAPEQDCARATLTFDGEASDIAYYTINGRRMVLSRDIDVEYNTLKFDETSFGYVQGAEHHSVASINGSVIGVDAPLCDTSFKISGDRFLSAWGEEESAESEVYKAFAVAAESKATQEERDNDNEQGSGSDDGADSFGGSAPCVMHFDACVTDAAIFREWQISRDPEFGISENTFNELSFDYTFDQNGSTYVRFVANNNDGTCEFFGPTYQIFIGESKLEIPNAFSPEASPGVNDEWKVSYKSIVSFECHIFNKWGQEVFSTTDPAQGWNGKYKGKYVTPGVYYYVIKARGADDIKYNRAGDINIIKYTQSTPSTGTTEP